MLAKPHIGMLIMRWCEIGAKALNTYEIILSRETSIKFGKFHPSGLGTPPPALTWSRGQRSGLIRGRVASYVPHQTPGLSAPTGHTF